MNKSMLYIAASLASLPFATGAFADSSNWSDEKRGQVLINRCANAGIGNGAEKFGLDPSSNDAVICMKRQPGFENDDNDLDPGKSQKNANNRKPF